MDRCSDLRQDYFDKMRRYDEVLERTTAGKVPGEDREKVQKELDELRAALQEARKVLDECELGS